MKQEDIKLLLKELCERLPHGVKVNWNDNIYYFTGIYSFNVCVLSVDNEDNTTAGIDYIKPYTTVGINYIKPYLFPMSSMTEEQKKEYNRWKHEVPVCHYEYGDVVEEVELFDSPESFEYLIENHFDYRGLIEKGLAIDATNKNIY